MSRRSQRQTGEAAAEEGRPAAGDDPAPGARKRMFMAGRVTAETAEIRFGRPATTPVDGPWTLAGLLDER